MNDLLQAMNKLCSDGVKFEPIGAVVQRGTNIRWADATARQDFQYIDLTSVDRVTHTITDTQTITNENAPSRAQQVVREGDVIFGTTRPMLKRYTVIPAEYDGQIASTGYCILRPSQDRILTNFLFHLLGTPEFYAYVEANERGASYPAITDSAIKAFRIPVPPIEAQREIVRVLDELHALQMDLEVALGAELAARWHQYARNRDALLTFGDDVPTMPMGDLGKFIRGRRFVKTDVVDEGIPAIHYGEIYTHYGVATESVISHVRAELADQLRYAEPGDVVFAAVGETVEDVAKAVAWLGDKRVAIHDDTFLFRSELNPKFVSFFTQTADFHGQKNKYVARAKVKRLSGVCLAKIAIPVPALKEQERVVGVLDDYSALANDLSVSLPAEISARRKQYEYYRNRLLTFENLPHDP